MSVRKPVAWPWFIAVTVALAAGTFAPSASQDQPSTQPTFRTSTNLVVIDAVVVDRRGEHVRDLTAADFEIVQNGRPMQVRQAVYVDATGGDRGAATSPQSIRPTPPRTDPAPARRTSISDTPVAENSRIIAIVVDDLGLSFESVAAVRRTLTKFVNEQVRPGDLVAILRTSSGAGALQQFTTDKRLLGAAVDRVRWTILSRSGITAFTPASAPDALGAPALSGSGTAEATDEDTLNGLRTQLSTVGSLGALEFVIRGVESLPGRKSVVFVSEGMRLFERPKGFHTGGSGRVWRAFTRVMDRANRAGVVVYALDARGLMTAGLTAEDDPQVRPRSTGRGGSIGSPAAGAEQAVLGSASERRAFLLDSQEALTYMAEQTGGFAVMNTNDLNLGLQRVLKDSGGYYLIGYEGAPETVRSWDPGRVTVRVKRPGLRVRSRKGLFGPADSGRAADATSADPLVMAAMSPFNANKLDVRVTGLFGYEVGKSSFLRSIFFINTDGIEFVRDDRGRHVAQLTLILLTIGEDGRIPAQWRRLIDLQLEPDTYRTARERGILYNARIPIKSAGGYQLRVAARDERTGALGSSSQFVEVPRVGKGRLALSSIVMQSGDAQGGASEPARTTAVADGLDAAVFAEPWVRIFRPGSHAIYTYEIYDGVSDGASTLTTAAVLMRDGRTLYRGPVSPLPRAPAGRSVRVVPVAGRLEFSDATEPGTYTLQVTVSQVDDRRVRRQQHQWATFEIR